MSALAEKLEAAGVDTIGARLTAACAEAIRRHPDNPAAAWNYAGTMFGHEFVRGLMGDMRGCEPIPEPRPRASPKASIVVPVRQHTPRVIAPERLENRRKLQQIIRSKFKNSGGVSWSDVGWHELPLLTRDGKEADALLAAYSANVPNDGRTVGDVLGIKKTDSIIAAVRADKL
jgi:hypothetical protein